MTKQEKQALKRQMKTLAGVRGEMRRAHFANGGDLAGWRGTANVIPDKKKRKNKRACRGKWRA